MNWVLFFPTFKAVSAAVGQNPTYIFLMNLSIGLSIPSFLLFRNLRWLKYASYLRRWSPAIAIASVIVVVAVVYYFLFANFAHIITTTGVDLLDFFSRSAPAFAVRYCLCFPALIGLLAALCGRSIQATTRYHDRTKAT